MSGLFDGVSGLALVAGLGLLVQQDIGGAGLDVNAAWWTSPQWIAPDGTDPGLISNLNDDQQAVPVLGPELVSNGDFSIPTTSPWTTNGTNQLSIVDNALRITTAGTPGFPRANRLIDTEPGKTYFFSAQARRVNGTPGAEVALYTSATQFIGSFGSTTSATFVTISGYFIAPTTSTMLFLNIASGTSTNGDAAEFDNVSLREVLLGDVGPELILNGDFSAPATGNPATGWQLNQPGTSAATISGGLLNLTGDGTNAASADQSFTTEVGASYTIVLFSSVSLNVKLGTTQDGIQNAFVATNANAWNSISFVATAATTWLRFSRVAAVLATVDNVSIRKWTPRPTLRSATFSEMFTFTASSTTARTYIDASGLLRNNLAVDQPRFTWMNGKRQLLLENQSQNQLVRSEDFANASWSKSGGATITADAAVAPDGTTTASLFSFNAASGLIVQESGVAVTAGSTVTASFFIKAASGTPWFRLGIGVDLTPGTYLGTWFNATTGALGATDGSGTVAGRTVTQLINGWWRVTLTGSIAAETTYSVFAYMTNSDNTTTRSTTSTAYIWGAQLEAQAFASSYIATTTAPVTRQIESARLSPLAQTLFNRAACTVVVRGKFSSASDAVSRTIFGNDGTGPLLFAVYGSPALLSNWNGALGLNVTLGSGTFNTTSFGAVLAFDSAGRAISGNGAATVSDTQQVGAKAVTYLGRSGVASIYGDGVYDNFVAYAARVGNGAIPAMAVAA